MTTPGPGAVAQPPDSPAAPLRLEVFTSPSRPIPGGSPGATFAPITSTLVYGDTDCVLVDAQFLTQDVDALGDLIARTGRRLQTIFVTHGHGDHWFGSDRLAARFGAVDIVATPEVVTHIQAHLDGEKQTWSALFGDAMTLPTSAPRPLDSDHIELEGNRLAVVEVPGGDIAPCAVLHIPALAAVVAGDVVYNQIHQMLAFGGPREWQRWSASVDIIEALRPQLVVAGHKKPDAPDTDVTAILDGTRRYLQDFADASEDAADAEDLVARMTANYPEHGNLTTLVVSARTAIKARARASG